MNSIILSREDMTKELKGGTILMGFNNRLYELRRQKGFSQEELANRLNVSRQTISKWEVGDSTPDMEKLIAISDLFGISLDELVLDKAPEQSAEAPAKADLYTDIKEKLLTDDNKKKAKKGLKIAAIVFGAFVLVDIISMIVYFSLHGFPK
ncbi:helix-turn-helix domain-containing protein [Ruminococcus sp.]|uniref:helix-turn-helix domain-containing protein n=1 Tax=Ruminococcus sp. TaxID=41978 RepID=UPI00345D2073